MGNTTSSVQDKPSVLIAGGGIGGLTAALALLQRGFQVQVLEQANELKEIGAGVQLSPNASRVLLDLGLREALERVVSPASRKQIRHFKTGDTWPLIEAGEAGLVKYGAPFWMIHRGDLHALLVEAVRRAAPQAIQTGSRVTALEDTGQGVRVQTEDGRTFAADVLIGADGIHSFVRRSLFGDTNATYLGRAAWRGLVPTEQLPEHLRERLSTNWIGPGGNAVTYPVRRGELINFVGAIVHPEWFEESWTAHGSKDECLAAFSGWHEDVQAIVERIETPMKWAYRGREPLMNWGVGNVTLLGDSAHPTLPTLAQGACMAIEDAAVLARCLAGYPAGEALRRYEQARVERTAKIVRSSTENATRLQDDVLGDPERAAQYIATQWAPEKVAERYDWLYEYDALTTPI